VTREVSMCKIVSGLTVLYISCIVCVCGSVKCV